MTAEEQARQEIDKQLAACGWTVQDHKSMNLSAAPGMAVREFPLETGPVDYLLYAGGKVIGVVEAKPEGHTLTGVEIQSRKYTFGVPAALPAWRRPVRGLGVGRETELLARGSDVAVRIEAVEQALDHILQLDSAGQLRDFRDLLKQLDEVEEEAQRAALKPFHNPALRELILKIKSDLEQVIDEVTQDELLAAEFGVEVRDKALSVMADFKVFCIQHKDEIDALKVLYSKPYRAGLRYRQVRELAAKLNAAPFHIDPNDKKNQGLARLWNLQAVAEPEAMKGRGGRQLVDLIALVRHAIHPQEPVLPVKAEVEANYQGWLAERSAAGVTFSDEQRKWLDAIRDHIASSLRIEQEELQDSTPFAAMGGLGKVYQLFGDELPKMLEELNERLAA